MQSQFKQQLSQQLEANNKQNTDEDIQIQGNQSQLHKFKDKINFESIENSNLFKQNRNTENKLENQEDFQEEILKFDIQLIQNIYERVFRGMLGLIGFLCLLFDIFFLKQLKDLEQQLLKENITDYQYDIFIILFTIHLFLGHFFGIAKKENPQFPIGKINKIGKIILRLLNMIGLSHILYLIYSAITGFKSQDFDKFNNAPFGTRRYWAHWHSVIVLYIYSHFMFVNETNWVIRLGYTFHVANIILSFIDYTNYLKCPNLDHLTCENCKCKGLQSLKKEYFEITELSKNQCINSQKYIKPQYQDQKKNKVNMDYNKLKCQHKQEPQQFYYKCGCIQHQCFLCEDCYQKELSHTNQSVIDYLWHQNKFFILLIPEVIGKPLFFGSISLVKIEKSVFFNIAPIRLSYDFIIIDCILLLIVLALPYIKIILTPSNKQMNRVTSLGAFYIFYFIQIIRNPYKREDLYDYYHQSMNQKHKNLYDASTVVSMFKKPQILEQELKQLAQKDNMKGIKQLHDSIQTIYEASLKSLAENQIRYEETKEQVDIVKYQQSLQFNKAIQSLMEQSWFKDQDNNLEFVKQSNNDQIDNQIQINGEQIKNDFELQNFKLNNNKKKIDYQQEQQDENLILMQYKQNLNNCDIQSNETNQQYSQPQQEINIPKFKLGKKEKVQKYLQQFKKNKEDQSPQNIQSHQNIDSNTKFSAQNFSFASNNNTVISNFTDVTEMEDTEQQYQQQQQDQSKSHLQYTDFTQNDILPYNNNIQ